MKIKPLESYRLYGTQNGIVEGQTYEATVATSIPDYKEHGFVFCNEILLYKSEYVIVIP